MLNALSKNIALQLLAMPIHHMSFGVSKPKGELQNALRGVSYRGKHEHAHKIKTENVNLYPFASFPFVVQARFPEQSIVSSQRVTKVLSYHFFSLRKIVFVTHRLQRRRPSSRRRRPIR